MAPENGLEGNLKVLKRSVKIQNDLLPRVHVNSQGFIWVNLDSSENPEPWTEDFEGIDD